MRKLSTSSLLLLFTPDFHILFAFKDNILAISIVAITSPMASCALCIILFILVKTSNLKTLLPFSFMPTFKQLG